MKTNNKEMLQIDQLRAASRIKSPRKKEGSYTPLCEQVSNFFLQRNTPKSARTPNPKPATTKPTSPKLRTRDRSNVKELAKTGGNILAKKDENRSASKKNNKKTDGFERTPAGSNSKPKKSGFVPGKLTLPIEFNFETSKRSKVFLMTLDKSAEKPLKRVGRAQSMDKSEHLRRMSGSALHSYSHQINISNI
eukprot:TRINITY_DN6538_c0_g1_i2.p1 TRINITY_DN6538_c0_g1~~TRINITY_DN6538_c0_g1_i2.p1  ORF type:complete len:192 (-),score=38.63 TRINITY_DN6538_c0_g1_i2:144-719(-)